MDINTPIYEHKSTNGNVSYCADHGDFWHVYFAGDNGQVFYRVDTKEELQANKQVFAEDIPDNIRAAMSFSETIQRKPRWAKTGSL